jgi:hypothetical protein
MEFSPCRSLYPRKLYRNRRLAVTLAIALAAFILPGSLLPGSSWLAAQILTPQFGRKQERDKGPRALGLVELSPKGKGRIIPIAIMIDGKFYDASAYKADPVPMALDFGIVYEGFRSGVSQGLFTITQPGQLNHDWIAEGTWLPAGAPDPHKRKKYAPPVIDEDDKSGPPILHRRSEKTDSDSDSKSEAGSKNTDATNKDQQKTAGSAPAPTASTPASAPNSPDSAKATTTPTAPEAAKTPAPAETAKASAPPVPSASDSDEPIEDPNRPRLRRGKPDATAHSEPYANFDALPEVASASPSGAAAATAANPGAKATKDSAATVPPVITIPAISDAGGPDPRPYIYDLKPAEAAVYRTKMLALAATLVQPQANAATNGAAGAPKKSSVAKSAGKSSAKSANKAPKLVFDDVSLRIFDLSNSNEPVLVLSAKTHPPAANSSGSVEEPKEITLIARTDLEGDLRKLFFSVTDSRHLDLTPRMELIDAVDADGDGRGELLFRRTFDSGSAYAIYRVTADGLWTLFEGTP